MALNEISRIGWNCVGSLDAKGTDNAATGAVAPAANAAGAAGAAAGNKDQKQGADFGLHPGVACGSFPYRNDTFDLFHQSFVGIALDSSGAICLAGIHRAALVRRRLRCISPLVLKRVHLGLLTELELCLRRKYQSIAGGCSYCPRPDLYNKRRAPEFWK